MPLLIVLIATLCTFIYYVFYKYKQSRNKVLFFKTTVHKPLLWAIGILLIAPIIINLFFPDTHFRLNSLHHPFVDVNQQKELLIQGDILAYYWNLIKVIGLNINIAGFISACLILVTWFIFINRIDFFNKEKLKYTLCALMLGMLFSALTFLISDSLNLIFSFELNGNGFHDLFISSLLGIGIIEEFVKLIPFFLILAFTREINEPFDYILYACMTALGFAFIENLGYFREFEGNVIQGRALLAVVGHMMFSSFCAYGFVLAKYNYKKSQAGYFLLSFLLGSFLHGFYDYLIFTHSTILLLGFFIFTLQAWTVIINNAINNSNFFDFKIAFQAHKLRFFLAIMLASILVISYFINAIQFGKELANTNFIATILFGGFFLIFYIISLSNYDLVKGYWRPITFRFSEPNQNQLPGNRGLGSLLSVFKSNYILPVNLVHYQVKIKPPHYNQLFHGLMQEISGEITDRICLYYQDKITGKELVETDWFVVTLKNELTIQPFSDTKCIGSHLLLRLEDKTDSILHDEDVRCFLRFISDLEQLKAHKAEKINFAYAGFVLTNSISVPEHVF